MLYHGSAVSGLTELKPLSRLHNSEQSVVYLSSSIPYVLLYIWDAGKTKSSRKWVTGGVKDGTAFYEEQFPGQLKAFYEGVRGYIYSALPNEDVERVQNREDMFFSTSPVRVSRVTEIPDVYRELLRYEREGSFKLFRFEDAVPEKQAELTDRIAAYIKENDLPVQGSEHAAFMRRYFVDAWKKATGEPV